MANLQVKDVPEALHRKIRAQAKRSGRTIRDFVLAAVVREIDRKGTEIWTKSFPGVFRASKLPNGNVLVASMNNREVAEMDRAGNIRWRVTTNGRPWAVHYR